MGEKPEPAFVPSLTESLLNFQTKNLVIGKDATNPAFKSTYASLSKILAEIMPSLNALGLLVSHHVLSGELVTTISNMQGEMETSSFPLFGDKPQQYGSSITYAKRYNLSALLNLNIDDDDDGNAAQQGNKTKKKPMRDLAQITKDIRIAPNMMALMKLYSEAMSVANDASEKLIVHEECAERKSIIVSSDE